MHSWMMGPRNESLGFDLKRNGKSKEDKAAHIDQVDPASHRAHILLALYMGWAGYGSYLYIYKIKVDPHLFSETIF